MLSRNAIFHLWRVPISSFHVLIFVLLPASVLANSAFGSFSFPQTDSLSSYNSLDTLNVTWSTTADNFTDPHLFLWGGEPPQKLLYNVSVAAGSTGSHLVPLNYGNTFNNSNFVLQQGGELGDNTSWYLSGSFYIANDQNVKPATYNLWPNDTTASTTSTTASSTSTSVPAETLFVTGTASNSAANSAPSTSNTAVIAVLATLFALSAITLGLLACCWCTRRQRRRSQRTDRGFNLNSQPETIPPASFAAYLRSLRNKQPPEPYIQSHYPETSIAVSALTSELPSGAVSHELPEREGVLKQPSRVSITSLRGKEDEAVKETQTQSQHSPADISEISGQEARSG